MKLEHIVTVVVLVQTLILFALGYEYRQRGKALAHAEIERKLCTDQNVENMQTLISLRGTDLIHTGQSFVWPDLTLTGEPAGLAEPTGGYRLVVFLSEQTCNVCQDRMIAFAGTVHQRFDAVRVTAVVDAKSRRYIRRLISSNEIEHVVFHDEENAFATANSLVQAPSAFLLFDNRVLASHYPSPSFPAASDPFYASVTKALER